MTDRLIFHEKDIIADGARIGPRYYIDGDCSPVAVRIDAERAPSDADLEVDILVDDSTIFDDRAPTSILTYGNSASFHHVSKTTAILPKGDNVEADADDFKAGAIIEGGSWVHCILKASGGAKNITVQLDIEPLSEPDESEE
ncbi:MAG: hypothetical protein WC657_09360 [Candidatus Paceibacterota bacterium]|jgi:hypothetical protein